jgi:hypothetical protein
MSHPDSPTQANAERILRILEADLDHPTTVEEWGDKLSLGVPEVLEALSLLTEEVDTDDDGRIRRRPPTGGTYWQGRMLDTRRTRQDDRAMQRAQSHLGYDPATGQAMPPARDPLDRIAGALERIAETLASIDRRLGRDAHRAPTHEGGRAEQRVRS